MLSVMIVDDERLERIFLRKILEDHSDDFQVVAEAEDGEEAIQLAELHQPDVVILDINMPVLNGLEAGRIIKDQRKATMVILNSAHTEFRFARQALEYDLDGFLVKPSQEEDILSAISACKQRKEVQGAGFEGFSAEAVRCPSYPFDRLGQLLAAITQKNPPALSEEARKFLAALKGKQQSLADYRLFIINAIFSVEHTLQEITVNPSLLPLLDSKKYLQRISQSTLWYDILADTEEFLSRLVILVENDCACQPSSRNCLQVVTQYIDNHFQEEIVLEDLGKLVYLSPSYLSRLFQKEKGVPLRKYINRKKVEHARHLLENTGLSIEEVARQCGYQNVSHFYRVFREFTEQSPAKYRKERSAP